MSFQAYIHASSPCGPEIDEYRDISLHSHRVSQLYNKAMLDTQPLHCMQRDAME